MVSAEGRAPPTTPTAGTWQAVPVVAVRWRLTCRARVSVADLLGSCPVPFAQYDRVLLGHGSGGRLIGRPDPPPVPARRSATRCCRPRGPGESARWRPADARIAFTTDIFVVRPLFFPGGDIGRLAVHGTVNDLAVGGADAALPVSAAFILEEGLPLDDLQRIVASMRQACDEAGVTLVTGDTKVVDRGKGDGSSSPRPASASCPQGGRCRSRRCRPGDRILVSGTIGDHGIAIMSVREGLEFETVLESDTAPLHEPDAGDARGLSRHPLHARPDARRACRAR